MRKTRLDFNSLEVESFETASVSSASIPTTMITVTHCIYCGITDVSCVTVCPAQPAGME